MQEESTPTARDRDRRGEGFLGQLHAGRNCWRVATADRVALIVDAAEYFTHLADVLARAEHSVFVVGWDLHTEVRLRPQDPEPEKWELLQLLDRITRNNARLDVHVLSWDFAPIYLPNREPLPRLWFWLRTRNRTHFHFAGRIPLGASHHQKMVVVDDRIAFIGGIDITAGRWDDSRHRPEHPLRRHPNGSEYGPVHEVQLAVDGAAAVALSALAREEVTFQSGIHLGDPAPAARETDLWPAALEPALRDASVAIARTRGRYDGRDPVREIEALYRDQIAAARELIYIENQYLTSHVICTALCERLQEPDGPSVVIFTTREQSGWLEQRTMGVLRVEFIRRLRAADRHGRAGIFVPVADRDGRCAISVHAKLMIIDDEQLRVGSANLSNRSMGLDNEADALVAVAPDDAPGRAAIRAQREALVCEHLQIEAGELQNAMTEHGSLLAVLQALGERCPIEVLDVEADPIDFAVTPDWIDIDEPPVDRLAEEVIPEELDQDVAPAWKRLAISVAAFAGLAALWIWGPLSAWFDLDRLGTWVIDVQRSEFPLLWTFGVFVAGALLMLPLTLLTAAAVFVLGFGAGAGIAYAGAMLAGSVGFLVGRYAWRGHVEHLTGRRYRRVSRAIGRRGLLTVVTLRFLPIAPFSLVNMIAGATRIGWRDYLLGSALGLGVTTLSVAVAAEQVIRAVREPSPATSVLAALALGLILAAVVALRQLVRRRLGLGKGRKKR